MKKIVIVAGDKSGDIYGGFLSKKLKEKNPLLEIYSFGGKNLANYSRQIIDLTAHSVSGLAEVLSSLKEILNIFNKTLNAIEEIKPDLVILIDFPDFNLRLAKRLNKKYPLFYYVSPQVWAWRKKRIESIKRYVDKMIVIFKFEEDFYRKQGIDALYFGHPLLEIIKGNNLETKKIISFLPGSRKNEIKKHLPLMQGTKKIIEKELSGYRFRLIRPENIEEDFYNKFNHDFEIVSHSYDAIQESKFIITSSGTATVEISILEVPFLIIYRLNSLTWQILKRMVRAKFIGMVNILASKKIVEELLQKEATPQRIAVITLEYVKNEEKYLTLKKELGSIKNLLYPAGATEKIAEYICGYLKLDT
jgi:lipid-A-disaccharide synthase